MERNRTFTLRLCGTQFNQIDRELERGSDWFNRPSRMRDNRTCSSDEGEPQVTEISLAPCFIRQRLAMLHTNGRFLGHLSGISVLLFQVSDYPVFHPLLRNNRDSD